RYRNARATPPTPAADPRHLQRCGLRDLRGGRRRGDPLASHTRRRATVGGTRNRVVRRRLGEHAAHLADRFGEFTAAVRTRALVEYTRHDHPVRADGLGFADARRAVAALTGAICSARRAADRDLAL